MKRLFSLFAILIFSVVYAQAQQTSGMAFLNIAPDPYQQSLSEATTAVYTGAASIYANPALTTYAESSDLRASYTFWIADTRNSYASALFKRPKSALGIAVTSSRVDDLELRTVPGEAAGDFSVEYLSISGTYARDFKFFSLGITGMYLFEKILTDEASGYGFTFGASSRLFQDRVTLGVSLRNLGQMSELNEVNTELPTDFRAGFNADILQFSTDGNTETPILISVSGDVIKPLNEPEQSVLNGNGLNDLDALYGNAAVRVNVFKMIELRSGFRFRDDSRTFSSGVGLERNNISFDFAYVPFETGFGNVFSLGLGSRF